MRIVVVESKEEVAARCLEYLKGPRVAVSGGTTFSALFKAWLPEIRQRVQAGEQLRFFPVDERKVPFDDMDCNWKDCYEQLLEPAGLSMQRNHLALSAKQYADLLMQEFEGGEVIFDQIFLGMGDDGHTASLFPGLTELLDRKSITLDVIGPKFPPQRVTLGFKPIWEAKQLIAVALGAAKAPIIKRLQLGDTTLPITLALAGHGNAVLILDQAAAQEIQSL